MAVRNRASRLPRGNADLGEAAVRKIDQGSMRKVGVGALHILSMASIVGSLVLFLRGRKMEGIFMGLWPPTFEALSAVANRR
ncbi:MAG TPA: hypothetical protein VM222_04775 [Planctomycetota bacterium]|nr:hypothetical protein [Planctomycetota bacterium]